MLCRFEKIVYPCKNENIDAGSFMIALYYPCERIKDSAGNLVSQVKAVGFGLPVSKEMQYDLQGRWSKNAKHGLQFEVESYDEVITPTKEGIIAYLSSGQIKGIGPKLAEKIYEAFGLETLNVLDKEPEKLLSISGVSEAKLKKISESYLENRAARYVVAFLSPYGITPNQAVKFYKEYKEKTLEIVKNHPYRLCEIPGIGFKNADKIAMSMGLDLLSTERVDEGILYTLKDAESKGHLCVEKHDFVKACLKTLDTPQLTEEMVANRAARLVGNGKIVSYQGNAYHAHIAYVEEQLAQNIKKQMNRLKSIGYENLDEELDVEETKLKMKFAPEQRAAVKMALTQGLSVITGGPGTGKTLIQRALLNIYCRQNPQKEVCCCAPTGRAARRMEQSTGFPALTVHKALKLIASEDENYNEPEALDADLILVDEVSMLDIYLAAHLFDAVKYGAQIVFIGDSDQLPSVGPGAVLSEMIASGCIPIVRLDKVFRQNAGSRIAMNAKLIRHGNLSLEYGDDFQFFNSPNMSESAELITELYMQEIEKYGVDNVALLTPYRQKTETGVNALNKLLQDKVNPSDSNKPEISFGNRKFRCGDKVMQIRNFEDISNGDIGYIKNITGDGSDKIVCVDFGDGRVKEYDLTELGMLDLGYASTIHKSQGSEYKSVIINIQCVHFIMLTRPLIYTAITRGKDRVIIVGEKRALCISIKKTDTEKRGTCLAKRLQELNY